ncbi:unnamed protein product, partial [marine sediment metagenome]
SNFIIQALQNTPLTVYGDGSQTRSFCYVDDMVQGLIALMNSPKDFTGPVNLGNPDEITIKELAKQVLRLTGSSSPIDYRSLPADDPVQRQPDITLAKDNLNWQPTVSLDEGLTHTIAFFKTLLSGKPAS